MTQRTRILGGEGQVPEWASFFTPAEYEHFVDLVIAHFAALGRKAKHEDGVLSVAGDGHETQEYGLANLSQLCHLEEPTEWPQLIAEHFSRLAQSSMEADALSAEIADLDKVSHMLKVRLYPEEAPLERAVARLLAPGLAVGLAFDLPSAVVSLQREDAERWGRSEEELFRIGQANLEAEGLITPQTFEVGPGCVVRALAGDSFFTATHALLLDRYVKAAAEGILVAVPSRHLVFFHPIQGPAAFQAVNAMLGLARSRFQEGPGSLSPHLYWYREGRFTQLPSRLEPEGLIFEPPEEFVATLEALTAPKH